MSTFAQMRSTIADILDRTDLTTQINLAINRAIKFYQDEPFWFKDTIATFPTVSGTKAYDTGGGIPSDIASIDYLEIAVSSSDERSLVERTYAYIEQIDSNHWQSVPTDYAWYNDSIYLYPIPNAVYTMRVSYQKTYTDLSADSDTNDWTTLAESLIESRACWSIYSEILQNPERAVNFKQNELSYLENLRRYTTGKTSTNPTTQAMSF
jgi:hypothetical protein